MRLQKEKKEPGKTRSCPKPSLPSVGPIVFLQPVCFHQRRPKASHKITRPPEPHTCLGYWQFEGFFFFFSLSFYFMCLIMGTLWLRGGSVKILGIVKVNKDVYHASFTGLLSSSMAEGGPAESPWQREQRWWLWNAEDMMRGELGKKNEQNTVMK